MSSSTSSYTKTLDTYLKYQNLVMEKGLKAAKADDVKEMMEYQVEAQQTQLFLTTLGKNLNNHNKNYDTLSKLI